MLLTQRKNMRMVISSVGMISSVGRDVVTSCASLRAGTSRPVPVDCFHVLDDENAESTPIIGHPIRGYTEGFHVIGQWIRLANGCFTDLIHHGGLPDRSDADFWQKTGLILVTPLFDQDRFQTPTMINTTQIKVLYGYRLLDLLECCIKKECIEIVCAGHAGTAIAIKQGMQKIDSTQLDRVIVLAVDSYLDPFTLEWLSCYNRLKTGDNPVGLAPGEAGACFLLESENEANRRRGEVHAVVNGIAVGKEMNHYFTEEVNSGFELSKVMYRVLPDTMDFAGDIISDLNGESWRAYEWACAQLKISKLLSNTIRLVLPCEQLGETGAASGALGVCIGVRSFARNYDWNGHVLVVSSSEHGNVGAIYISRP